MKPMLLVGLNPNTSVSKRASVQCGVCKELLRKVHGNKKLNLSMNRRKVAQPHF